MKRIGLFLLLAGAAIAADNPRDFAHPCSNVFPAAVRVMTAAAFEPTLSDSAGGLLTMKFIGEPMVYGFFVKKTDPFLAKYTAPVGKARRYNGLTFVRANLTFTGSEAACRVELHTDLAALSSRADSANRQWVRVAVPIPSNGTAENEFLDAIGAALQ